MATQTPNYSFQKPTVSGDSGVWGGYLNDNFTSLDNLLGGNTVITGIDINSGSIDGTAIGANAVSTQSDTLRRGQQEKKNENLASLRATISFGAKVDILEQGGS